MELGFDAVKICKAEYDPAAHDRLLRWLDCGYAGKMKYLERKPRSRVDPRSFLADAKSIICVAMSYWQKPDFEPNKPYVSIYARGKIYQEVIRSKLQILADQIRTIFPGSTTKIAVDTSPTSDKLWAARAGLGWQGKNTLIINKNLGSFIFLGEIFTDAELEYDRPITDGCQSCDKCIKICPTGALIAPGILDARKCISYMTVEFPEDQTNYPMIGNHVFGCDLCQLVCPYNRRPKVRQNVALQRETFPDTEEVNLWTIKSDIDFQSRFSETILGKYGFNRFTMILSAVTDNIRRLNNLEK